MAGRSAWRGGSALGASPREGPWPSSHGGRAPGYASDGSRLGAAAVRSSPPRRGEDKSNDELRFFLSEAEAEMDRLEAMLRERVLRGRQAGPKAKVRGKSAASQGALRGRMVVGQRPIRDETGRATGYVRVEATPRPWGAGALSPPPSDLGVTTSLTKRVHKKRDEVQREASAGHLMKGARESEVGGRRAARGFATDGQKAETGTIARQDKIQRSPRDARDAAGRDDLRRASIYIQAFYRGFVVRKKLLAHKDRAMAEKVERERFEENLRRLKGEGQADGEADPSVISDESDGEESTFRIKIPGGEERIIHTTPRAPVDDDESGSDWGRMNMGTSNQQQLIEELEATRAELRAVHATVALQLERMKVAEEESIQSAARAEALQKKLDAINLAAAIQHEAERKLHLVQEAQATRDKEAKSGQPDAVRENADEEVQTSQQMRNLLEKADAAAAKAQAELSVSEARVRDLVVQLDNKDAEIARLQTGLAAAQNSTGAKELGSVESADSEALRARVEEVEAEAARARDDLNSSEAKVKDLTAQLDIMEAEVARCQAERMAAYAELHQLRGQGTLPDGPNDIVSSETPAVYSPPSTDEEENIGMHTAAADQNASAPAPE